MIPADETFDGTWPYAPRFFSGRGFRMHYVDVPGQGDETFLLLHGEPTWGYLYRNIIPGLLRFGRVVVPDHMGFGKSETPQGRTYSIVEHADNLQALVEHLALRDITLVGQDWGGPIGTAVALARPELFRRFCYMNTGVPGMPPAGAPRVEDYPWFKWVQTEESRATLANLGATILSVLKRIGFERTAHVNETWVRAYASAFPTSADCAGALAFPAQLNRAETRAAMAARFGALPQLAARPAMYLHGEEDRAIPTDFSVGAFRSTWPNGPVVTLPGVGHFIQEDAPEAVTALICQFVQMT
ncbi:MAG: alpha/beta fold hydrolase [Pseudomonadales bacterium]|nr:alpha/beta fold hydrolase [Pseudomonadales bacterium]